VLRKNISIQEDGKYRKEINTYEMLTLSSHRNTQSTTSIHYTQDIFPLEIASPVAYFKFHAIINMDKHYATWKLKVKCS
jgi:hypothetical protein